MHFPHWVFQESGGSVEALKAHLISVNPFSLYDEILSAGAALSSCRVKEPELSLHLKTS